MKISGLRPLGYVIVFLSKKISGLRPFGCGFSFLRGVALFSS